MVTSHTPENAQNQGTESLNSPFAVAWKLHTLGYSVLPSGGGENHKSPKLQTWAEYETRRPTDDELTNWQASKHPRLWGVVTGAISGVVVIDADTPEARAELEAELGKPHVITPRGGGHFYFAYPGYYVKSESLRLLPGIDIRGDGGFCNIVGRRPEGEYQILTLPAPDTLLPWGKLPERIIAAMKGSRARAVGEVISEVIPEGQRNATLTSHAGSMRRRGMPQSAIEAALLAVNQAQCQPPLPESEVKDIAASISRYPPYTGNNSSLYNSPSDGKIGSKRDNTVTDSVTTLAELIERFVTESSGWFSYEDVDREFGINDTKAKDNRRQIIKRLKDNGRIEAHPRNNKLFRYVNTDVRLIDFKSAGMRKPLDIRYPFEIEKYFRTYPGNVIAIAGAADSGKTAWLLNLIRQNQENFSIYYQSSEMGKEELASRLQNFEGISLENWNFTAEERSRDFADVIRPDCVNIIDYMELSTDFYQVAEYLREIHDKLAGGICLVAIQKKRGAELGRGGDFGLEKPRLYLSMDVGKCTIQKAKNWVDPTVNPNGLVIRYKIVGGCKFIVTEGWNK